METKKNTKKVVPESSFNKGWSQIPPCHRDKACEMLMKVLNIGTKSQFYARLRGEVEPKKSQVAAIEAVFARFDISEIWGLEPFKSNL